MKSRDAFLFIACLVLIMFGVRALIIYVQNWSITFDRNTAFLGFVITVVIILSAMFYVYGFIQQYFFLNIGRKRIHENKP